MSACEMKTLLVLFIDEEEWQGIGLCYSKEIDERFGFVVAKMSNGNSEYFRTDHVRRIKLVERR